jgi:branched-chain amino acid transport system ATP-binding protein
VLDNLIVGHRLRTHSGLWDVLVNTGACATRNASAATRPRSAGLRGPLARGPPHRGDISQEERKRVAFALALATDPELMLLDEPAGGVNPEETVGLAALIRKLVDHGLTVCLIEHKMDMIMNLADKIVVLNNGEKIAEGTPAEIRRQPACHRSLPGERPCCGLKASTCTTAAFAR